MEVALETLGQWLVQQPGHILLVAMLNLALWALCRATVLRAVPRSNVLWVPAVLWLAYAAWEWLVSVRTPEANIRVDLLLVWPVIALVTLWAFARAAGGWWSARSRAR
jgi:hypothetical protein